MKNYLVIIFILVTVIFLISSLKEVTASTCIPRDCPYGVSHIQCRANPRCSTVINPADLPTVSDPQSSSFTLDPIPQAAAPQTPTAPEPPPPQVAAPPPVPIQQPADSQPNGPPIPVVVIPPPQPAAVAPQPQQGSDSDTSVGSETEAPIEQPQQLPIPAPAPPPVAAPRPQVRTLTIQAPVKPIVTCEYQGSYYFPGQKRYDCSEPRERGVCEADAGYGVPYICSGQGTWDVANDGIAECANACAASEPIEANASFDCPAVGDTCIYSEARDDGQGATCYSGTGGEGFNPPAKADGSPGCNFSCGPVVCPVLPDSETPAVIIPTGPQLPPSEGSCSGEIYQVCSEDGNHSISLGWSISPEQAEENCNVFIKDEFGDHLISNLCNSSWYGTQVPGGAQIKDGGTYELYVSNGTETCFNKFASNIQLSCQTPQEGTFGLIQPTFEWFSETF